MVLSCGIFLEGAGVVKLVSNEILSSKEAIIPILNISLFKREGRGRVRYMEGKRVRARQKENQRENLSTAPSFYTEMKKIYLGVNNSKSLGVA
jgi:hypothetical protein